MLQQTRRHLSLLRWHRHARPQRSAAALKQAGSAAALKQASQAPEPDQPFLRMRCDGCSSSSLSSSCPARLYRPIVQHDLESSRLPSCSMSSAFVPHFAQNVPSAGVVGGPHRFQDPSPMASPLVCTRVAVVHCERLMCICATSKQVA